MKEWTPRTDHDSLEAVPGGHVYRASDVWWAHPEGVKSGYSWGPYLNRDVALAALRRGSDR